MDLKIVREIASEATLIVVGEVVKQPVMDSATYGFEAGLLEHTPFRVLVHRVLFGSIATKQPISVGLIRDEKEFRYPMRQPLIFFLKRGGGVPGKSYDPLMTPAEWLAVSDYFGIIPHQMLLESMVKDLKAQQHPLLEAVPLDSSEK